MSVSVGGGKDWAAVGIGLGTVDNSLLPTAAQLRRWSGMEKIWIRVGIVINQRGNGPRLDRSAVVVPLPHHRVRM